MLHLLKPNIGNTDYPLGGHYRVDEGKPKGVLLPGRKMKNVRFQQMLIHVIMGLAAILTIQYFAAVE